MKSPSVGIIGAGVAGLTSAYVLAQRGCEVTLMERHSEVAFECSHANGGQISVCNAEVWNQWKNVRNAILWMFRRESPFGISASMESTKWRWLAQFFCHTLSASYEPNTRRNIALALASRARLAEVIESEKLSCDQSREASMLHIYRRRRDFHRAQRACERFADSGWSREAISAEQLVELEPSLARQDIVGGTIAVGDYGVDIHHFCTQLATVMKQRYGVGFLMKFDFASARREGGKIHVWECQGSRERTFDHLAIAAGAGSDPILRRLQIKPVGIYPVKGYSITLRLCEPDRSKVSSRPLLDELNKIVSCTFRDRLRVAGIAELNGWDLSIPDYRVAQLLRWVQKTFPMLEYKHDASWSCLRPMRACMTPVCHQVAPQVHINSGAGHMGWTLAMAGADLLATAILG